MKYDDLKCCIRPVIFNMDNEYTPYRMKGTSFGVSTIHGLYIITLEHIIQAENPENILISYGLKTNDQFRSFLPINEKRIFKNTTNDEDTDKYDLVALRIDMSLLNSNLLEKNSFIDINNAILPPSDFNKLIIFGFPDECNEVEYDIDTIKNQRLIISATWVETSRIEGCQTININPENNLLSYSGLSGSPVFGLKDLKNGTKYVQLLGVMHRATKQSGIGYFLDVERIKILTSH